MRSTMTEPLIVCENLVKIYKVTEIEVVALQGLDLTVEPRRIDGHRRRVGIGQVVAAQRAGRTRSTFGRARDGGRQDLLKMSDRELDRYRRTKVGFVWQQVARNLVPYLSAQANVELPMTVARLKPQAETHAIA